MLISATVDFPIDFGEALSPSQGFRVLWARRPWALHRVTCGRVELKAVVWGSMYTGTIWPCSFEPEGLPYQLVRPHKSPTLRH
jgi:hypothetical protein